MVWPPDETFRYLFNEELNLEIPLKSNGKGEKGKKDKEEISKQITITKEQVNKMNYKIQGAIKRNRKNFIIFAILWLFIAIVLVAPFAYSSHMARIRR